MGRRRESKRERGRKMGNGKRESGRGRERKRRRRKRSGKDKEGGRWKEESLRKLGRTDGHSGDFILCPMLCIALDRQYR